MNLAELLQLGRQQLATHSSSAALDARLLLCDLLEIDPIELFKTPERSVDSALEQAYLALLQRRRAGEPVAYLLGYKAFYGHCFRVNTATLIPRPETELLVERTLALLTGRDTARVAELGTGSGAIAISLALARPQWQLLAIDQSLAALDVARLNAERLLERSADRQLASTRLRFRHGDWLQGVEQRFDLIVSNPPYVAVDDPHLQQGDVRFEPISALVAAGQGMAAIGQIAAAAGDRLFPGGWLVVEHGYQQGRAVRSVFSEYGFNEVVTHCDLAGHERVTEGRVHLH